MAILTKHTSFEDLKSSKNLLTKDSSKTKELNNEFENFISILRSNIKTVKQSNNNSTANGQESKR